MKFATVTLDGSQRWGHITDEGFHDLSEHFPQYPTLRDVIADVGLEYLRNTDVIPTCYSTGFSYDIPIPNPEKIICVGVNFPDRNAEYKDGQEAPPNMSLFPRFSRSFVGHGAPLTRPPESEKLDYEGEIAIVIGKGGRRIPQDSALSHIAALTLCNEGTIRDWVRHAKFNVTQGKNWDGSGAMGPWLIEFKNDAQITDIELKCEVNGEVRQQDRTARMLFPVARQIAYISTFTTLVPGDIIVTGTPTGAGARFDPPKFLKPGDEIKVSGEGIGELVNGVVDE